MPHNKKIMMVRIRKQYSNPQKSSESEVQMNGIYPSQSKQGVLSMKGKVQCFDDLKVSFIKVAQWSNGRHLTGHN